MQKVIFEALHVELAEARQNDIYMTVLMRMFSTRPNRNGFAVSAAFIDNIVANAAKYTCLPQCADANRLRRGDTQGQTHMLDAQSGRFESEQIGSFFAFYRAVDAEGVISLIGEARIPKRQPELCETLCRLYHAGVLNFSFEISVALLTEQDGVRVIDAAEGNELIGMAVVTHPACPEATALRLVAEEQNDSGRDETDMDEKDKRIAELESKLQQAEQKSECDEELRKKDEELEEAEKKCSRCEAELAECRAQLAERDERIAGLETQVAELTPFKAEAEQLQAEKAAAELAARQQELTRFAEAQGLDLKADVIAEAIRKADYATLVAEVVKAEKPAVRPVVASYAMGGGIAARGEYDDLLGKA